MTLLIFQPFTKMAFSGEDKPVTKFLRQNKHYGAEEFLKEFPYKRWSRIGLEWIRLFARLIVLELRNVFPAVAVRELLELLTKCKKLKHLFLARKICRKHTVLKDKLLGKLVGLYLNVP